MGKAFLLDSQKILFKIRGIPQGSYPISNEERINMMKRTSFFVAAMICGAVLQNPVYAQVPENIASAFTHDELVAIGEQIYQTPGQQTCQKCHREEGQGEGWAGAKDLRKPYTWNSFNALGGYDALEEDSEAFLKNLHTVLYYLIEHGGVVWNTKFKSEHPEVEMDWSLTNGKTQYDMMMWGTVQKEMKEKIAIVKQELVDSGKEIDDELMRQLAVVAVFEYVKTFEEENEENEDAPLIFGSQE